MKDMDYDRRHAALANTAARMNAERAAAGLGAGYTVAEVRGMPHLALVGEDATPRAKAPRVRPPPPAAAKPVRVRPPPRRPTNAIDMEPKGEDRRTLARLGVISPQEEDLE